MDLFSGVQIDEAVLLQTMASWTKGSSESPGKALKGVSPTPHPGLLWVPPGLDLHSTDVS